MKSKKQYSFYLFIIIALVIPVMAFGGYYLYNSKIESLPYYGSGYTLEEGKQTTHYKVADIALIDQNGNKLSLYNLGKSVKVINLFFAACPKVCPRMMANMQLLQQKYAGSGNVHLLSITVNPEDDNVSILKEYAQKRNINSQFWTLANGDKKAIYQFARNSIFLVANSGDGGPADFIHSDKLVLLDSNNQIRGYYDGSDPKDIQNLVNDIKRIQ